MTDLILRDSTAADQEAIKTVTLAAYEQYSPMMGPMWQLYRTNIVETLADTQPAEQIVAEHNGEVVGTVLLYPANTAFNAPDDSEAVLHYPEVRLLAVTPAARGLGAGKALMEECIRRARKAGVKAVTLHTHEMMAVAMAMYERMGFQRAPELDFKPAPQVTIKGYRYNLTES